MYKAINHHTTEIAEGDNFKAIYQFALDGAISNLMHREPRDIDIFVGDVPKYSMQVWIWHCGDYVWGSIELVNHRTGQIDTVRSIDLEKGAKA